MSRELTKERRPYRKALPPSSEDATAIADQLREFADRVENGDRSVAVRQATGSLRVFLTNKSEWHDRLLSSPSCRRCGSKDGHNAKYCTAEPLPGYSKDSPENVSHRTRQRLYRKRAIEEGRCVNSQSHQPPRSGRICDWCKARKRELAAERRVPLPPSLQELILRKLRKSHRSSVGISEIMGIPQSRASTALSVLFRAGKIVEHGFRRSPHGRLIRTWVAADEATAKILGDIMCRLRAAHRVSSPKPEEYALLVRDLRTFPRLRKHPYVSRIMDEIKIALLNSMLLEPGEPLPESYASIFRHPTREPRPHAPEAA